IYLQAKKLPELPKEAPDEEVIAIELPTPIYDVYKAPKTPTQRKLQVIKQQKQEVSVSTVTRLAQTEAIKDVPIPQYYVYKVSKPEIKQTEMIPIPQYDVYKVPKPETAQAEMVPIPQYDVYKVPKQPEEHVEMTPISKYDVYKVPKPGDIFSKQESISTISRVVQPLEK